MTSAANNRSAFEADLQAAFAGRGQTSPFQRVAFDRFVKSGAPGRRVEGWRWSDFHSGLAKLAPTANTETTQIAASAFAPLDAIEVRIANGEIHMTDATVEGLEIERTDPVANIAALENHALVTLNQAMAQGALRIAVAKGAQITRPIHLRHIQDGGQHIFTQVALQLGSQSSAHMIESFEGDGAGFSSHLLDSTLGEGAQLRRSILVDSAAEHLQHSVFNAELAEGAFVDQTSLSLGAKLSRNETHLQFNGTGAHASLNSAALLSGARHSDFTTNVRHRAESCQARQIHKGVARDSARNVFQGKFHVDRAAQKTDAQMTANALLLSDRAEANHKPELEIYADDVECAHGSTAGALDEDALFYLRQRGLSEETARGLLIEAFIGEVIDGVEDEKLRFVLQSRVHQWLEAS